MEEQKDYQGLLEKLQKLEEEVKTQKELLRDLYKDSNKIERRDYKGNPLQLFKHSLEEIAREAGVDAEKLGDYARSGFAPCLLGANNEPRFRKNEILNWIKDNMFREVIGRSLPARPNVFIFTNEAPKGVPIPRELDTIEGLAEYAHYQFPPCIYFLVRDNKVVYVGQSVSLPVRIQTHLTTERKDFNRVLYLPVPMYQLNEAENEYIRALRPEYNMAGKKPIGELLEEMM